MPMKTTSLTALGLTLWLMPMFHAAAHTTEEVLNNIRQNEPYLQLTDSVAPDFVLEDAAGRKIGLADYRGKAVVLNFIYARCKDACPLQSVLLAKVQAQVNATLMRDLVQFVTIATDTEDAAATAEVMRGYGKIHGLDPANWVFLYRGSGAPVAGIKAAKTYGLEFVLIPGEEEQMHGVVTHVIDQQGVMRARFHGLKFQPFHLTAFVNTVLYPDHDEAAAGASSTPVRGWGSLRNWWSMGLLVLGFSLLVMSGLALRRYRAYRKAVVLNFIYARCKDACPLHSELLAKVQAQVNATLMRDQVQFVTIATDTEDAAATAELMRDHGKIHGLDPANWVFLYRGSGAPNSGINIAKAYGLEFTPTPDGDQMHGVVTHVIDLDGVMRARFHGLKFQPFHMTAFVNTVLYPDHHEEAAGALPRGHEGLRYPWIISLVVLMVALLVVSWLVLRRRRAQHKMVGLDSDQRAEGAQEKREPGSTRQTDA